MFPKPDPAATEAAWLAEAERRYVRFLDGETTAASVGEALGRVRARLRHREPPRSATPDLTRRSS